MFGQPSPFGSAPATNTPFGAPAPSAFGSTTAPGAAGTTGGFGSTAGGTNTGGFGGFGSAAPAPAATGGFGGFGSTPAPAAGGFGSFGSTATNATSNTSTGFGTNTATNTSTPFGAPAPAAGGGLFGNAPAPATGGGLFGGGATNNANTTNNAFGATTTNTGFGAFGAPAPAPTNNAFGAPSAFGAPAPAAGGGLFGSAAPAPSAFGAPTPATNNNAGGGLFGSTTTTNAFGSPAPAAGGGLFGSAPTTATPGAGNGSLAVPYQVTNKSDNNITISLQSITAMSAYESNSLEELRLQDYFSGNKGSQGQNNAAQGNTSTFGGFGTANTNTTSTFGAPASGGLFGSAAPAPAFGAPSTAAGGGLFGAAPTPAPSAFGFGAPAAPAPATSFGGFGSPAPAPAAGGFAGFGTAAAAPKPGGLFGSPTPAPATGGGLFGSAAPAPSTGGGLFGSAAAPSAGGGLFGSAAAPKPGGLFGTAPAAPAPAGGGLFGSAPAPAAGGGLFGKAPAPAGGLFGAPAPTPAAGGGLFGAPAAGGGIFGAPAPTPTAGGGLFGAPTPAPAAGGGIFGAPAAGGGLFGAPAPAAGGGLFGAPAPATGGGLFGAPAAAPAGGGLFGSTPTPAVAAPVQPPSADVLLAQQLAAVESQKKELSLLQAWRGTPPDGSSVVIPIDNKTSTATNASSPSSPALMASLLSYQAGPRSAVKIRPRAFTPSSKTTAAAAGSIGRGTTNNSARSPLLSPDSFLGSSAKKLVIKPGSLTPKPKLRLLLQNGSKSSPNNLSYQNQLNDKSIDASPMPSQITNSAIVKENQSIMLENTLLNGASPPFVSPDANQTKKQIANENIHNNDANRELAMHSTNTTRDEDSSSAPNKSNEGIAYDFYQKVICSPSEEKTEYRIDSLPKLTKEGYRMFPTMEDIQHLSETDLMAVSQFEIRRDGIGSIVWDGAVDVRGLDLDNIVSIEPKDVAVYDAAEIAGTKPPVGSKLNRPAVITMYEIWPKGGSESSTEAKERMEIKITKQTKKMDAELLSYSSDAGIWKFRVKHFSRYGLIDDDSDDEDEDLEVKNTVMSNKSNTKVLDFKLGGRGGRSPGDSKRVVGRSRILAPVNEEDDISYNGSDIVPLASENDVDEILKDHVEDEEMIIEAADKAYNELSHSSESKIDSLQLKDNHSPITSKITLADEGCISNDYNLPGYTIQTQQKLSPTNFNIGSSICAKLAKKAGLKNLTSSSTDFGMRMGKSFGVAWRPDGSLLIPKPKLNGSSHNRVWVQCRPIIKNNSLSHSSQNKIVPESIDLLTTHLKNSIKKIDEEDDDSECPVFTLVNNNHQKVLNILNDFAVSANKNMKKNKKGKNDYSVLSDAFELIKSLEYGYSCQSDTSLTCPREALLSWIRKTVESDVDEDVNLATAKNDKYGAIFAAMTGVDTYKASCIAMKNDAARLSHMIATSIDPLTRDDINSQMEHWEKSRCTNLVPKTLLRTYYLLSGNLGLEEALFKNGPDDKKHSFDWKRRLGMLLWCSDDKNHDEYMSTIISNYEQAVSKGLAPAPQPWYDVVLKEKSHENCLLFKLLKFYALSKDGQCSRMSLGETISPCGYTPSIHDVSGSFHLSAAVSMLDITPSLTLEEEMKLIDSYSFQLINSGMWEWAVFINLCCISSYSKNNQEIRNKKKRKAMSIVLRHWNGDSDKCKVFLQNSIGIPGYWFDIALAYKCAQVGDAYGYVKHAVKFSVHDAIVIFNANILPFMLSQGGKNESQNAFDFADILCAKEGIPGTMIEDYHDSMIASEYLRLSREVLELSLQPEIQRIERNDEVMALLEQAKQLENKIVNTKKVEEYPQSCFRYVQPISSSVSSSELSSSLLLLVTQLKSILAGHSIFEKKGGNAYNNMKVKYASQLATLLFSEDTLPGTKNEHLLDSANMEQAKHYIQWKII